MKDNSIGDRLRRIGSAAFWIGLVALNIYLFRENRVVAAFLSIPADFYRERISSGSVEARVPLPSGQRAELKLDTWKIIRAGDTAFLVVDAHNGSDWVISSFDFEIETKRGEKRIFRAFPRKDGEPTLIGPKQPLSASADLGVFYADGASGGIRTVYGYKNN